MKRNPDNRSIFCSVNVVIELTNTKYK